MQVPLVLLSVLVCTCDVRAKSRQDSGSTRRREDSYDDSVLTAILTDFMADSQVQLILDLDLFRSLFIGSTEKFEKSVKGGEESYLQHLLGIIQQMKEYDVSAPCLADIAYFLWSAVEYAREVRTERCTNCSCSYGMEHQWIFNVLDAFGKMPAGLLGGNNLWIGSWSSCRRISVVKNRQGQRWSGQYCMASFQPFNRDNPLKAIGSNQVVDPASHCFSSPLSKENESASDDGKCFDLVPLLNYGICTPDTCTDYDVRKMITLLYKSAEAVIEREVVCSMKVTCRNNRPESQMSHDPGSMTALCFMIFIGTIVAFGTLYDYIVYQKLAEGVDGAMLYSHQSWFVKVLLSFSVYTNGKFILRTAKGEKQIHCLHGTRVLSMFWIILGHTYYYTVASLTMDNTLPALIAFPQKFFNMIIVQAPLAVDSFFYLSGMLTSYIFMEKFSKEAAKGKSIFAPDMWALYYIHRFIRLTPIYLVIMVLDLTLFTYISDGPFWRPIERNYCRRSWWTNLIYLNNFLRQEEECMGWTWYMANDMQFHMTAPIFLILLFKSSIFGVLAIFCTIAMSSVVHLWITTVNNYPPAPLLTADLQIVKDLETYWPDVYVKPYIRCTPYLLGLLVGFTLHKLTLHPVLPKWKVAVGWIVSGILLVGSMFGLYDYARTGKISELARISYVLLGRNGFAVSLAWITFACAAGYGGAINTLLSWRAWIPLSRITFCAYLVHPMLLQIYNLSRPHPFHFTATYQMMYLYAVAVVMAYFTGAFLSLAFEIPVMILEGLVINNLVAKIRGNGRQKNDGVARGATHGDIVASTALLSDSAQDKSRPPSKTNGHCERT